MTKAHPGRVAQVDDAHLQGLLDREACERVMKTYCRAIDHLDEPLLRSLFHSDARHHHGFEGPSSAPQRQSKPGKPADFVAFAFGFLRTYKYTHHQLGNVQVDLEGDGVTAFTEAYFTAFHRMRASSDPKAGDHAYDQEMDFFVGGRYLDRMEKRAGTWKIAHRIGTTDWTRLEAGASQGVSSKAHPDQRSLQSRRDIVYRRKRVMAKR